MPTNQFQLIANRLSQPIPAPYRPPPKPAQSWHRLKVTDPLILRIEWRTLARTLPAGTRLRVSRCFKSHVCLTGEPYDFEVEWSDPLWEQAFERAPRERKPSKPRANKVKRPPIQTVDDSHTQD